MTWYSTGPNRYPVAELTPAGKVRLLFGKHSGRLLEEVQDSYRRWLTTAPFVPDEVRDLAARPEPVDVTDALPDLRDRRAVLAYIIDARRAGDIADLAGHLRDLLEAAEVALQDRERARAGLLANAIREALTDADHHKT